MSFQKLDNEKRKVRKTSFWAFEFFNVYFSSYWKYVIFKRFDVVIYPKLERK